MKIRRSCYMVVEGCVACAFRLEKRDYYGVGKPFFLYPELFTLFPM
jgi:hypothetical protein